MVDLRQLQDEREHPHGVSDRLRARQYTREHGEDDPAIGDLVCLDARAAGVTTTPSDDTSAELN